jgi:endo-1,4-beta-xylanase
MVQFQANSPYSGGWLRSGRFKISLSRLVLAIGLSACGPSAPGAAAGELAPLGKQGESFNRSIQQIRTAPVVVQVVDSQNRPVPNAEVRVEQTRHRFEFGTALATHPFVGESPAYRQYLDLAKQLFNAGVHENALKWRELEKASGQINYADSDRILTWAQQQNWTMRGHTLFWEVEEWVPQWLKPLSKKELESKSQAHANAVCQRYRGKFVDYDVNNEMLHGNFFRQRLGDRIVGQMFRWCKAADPTAKLYVNDYNILNEQALDRYVDQIRSYLKQGVAIEGIGVQAHIRQPTDAAQVTRVLDKLAQFNLPIKITEFGAVGKDDADQARILRDVYTAAFAHPKVEGIYMWGFWEGANWEPKAAIFRQDFQPRPAAKTYRDLVFNQWWTKAQGQTNAKGEYALRPFGGQHELTVKALGKTVKQSLTVVPKATGQAQKDGAPQVVQVKF